MKFNITKHAKDRYLERIHINSWENQNIFLLMLSSLNGGKVITSQIYDKYPRYIVHLYETHKTAAITFIEDKDKNIFVCKRRPGTDSYFDVVTCYKDTGYFDKFLNTALSREDIFLKIKELKKKYKNV